MADTARARRLAKRIVTIVATELQHQVKDPRLAMVTVTAATVTPDLREATVFYTVYGDQNDIDGTAIALRSATGVIRSAVGQQTGIKFTPTLVFKLDAIPENAHRINELLEAARSADAQVAERAAGASYAGDPDPYKVPRVDDADDDDAGDDDLNAAALGATGDDDDEISYAPGSFVVQVNDEEGADDEDNDGEFDDPTAAVTHRVR